MERIRYEKTVFVGMTVLAVLLNVPSASAQGKLEGAWRLTEVTIGGQSPFNIALSATHPNLFIYTKKHWSALNIGTPSQPDLPQQGATDAQRVATWAPFIAGAGTYEVQGNIITIRTIVAKNPSEMVDGNFSTSEFKIEGETMTLMEKTNQNGTIANPMITKLVQVE